MKRHNKLPSQFCYFNGDLINYDQVHIHVSDLLFQRGYGVFDFFRARKGALPWLEDYTERLFRSLKLAGIEPDLDREEFESIIQNLQQKNGLANGAFKVIVTGGYSDNLEFVTGKANMVILNMPWKKPPGETFEKGVHLISEEFVRPNPEIKTLYYLNTLKLQKKLKTFKAVDVMFHTHRISECSRANLFFVRGGKVFTPASDILKGITRKQVLSLHGNIQITDIETRMLYDFDEIFLTSTSRDVTPVVAVDGKSIGKGIPGPLTREIMATFSSLF